MQNRDLNSNLDFQRKWHRRLSAICALPLKDVVRRGGTPAGETAAVVLWILMVTRRGRAAAQPSAARSDCLATEAKTAPK
jgi:hypothetical protein